MTPTERRVLAGVLAELTKRQTKRGHAAIIVGTESLGYCRWNKPCGPTCLALKGAITAAEALLAESAPLQIVQASFALDRPDDAGGRAVS